ncbi:sarcosine oxidase subunit delta [Segnochrobactraceae bacterium EtOH-i3]
MLISCPYCGLRDAREFAMLGDAALMRRPDPEAADAAARFHAYAYLRDNPAGPHRELWFHAGGCGKVLVLTRDTQTHEVLDVQFADRVARTEGGA